MDLWWKVAVLSKCRQNWRTVFSAKSTQYMALKHHITPRLRLANEVCSSYRVNRQTDRHTHRTTTVTLAHAPRVNETVSRDGGAKPKSSIIYYTRCNPYNFVKTVLLRKYAG